MANRAHDIPMISIHVTSITPEYCEYYMMHDKTKAPQKPYHAENVEGLLTLRLMKAGGDYVVTQKIMSNGRTKWVHAEQIINRLSQTKSVVRPAEKAGLLQF
jgi:hypothetical protein